MDYGSTRTQLVPVSSGEQTTVTLPESLKSANTRLNSMADTGELTGGIAIVDSKDKTATAEVSISVSDPLDRDINPTKENTVIYEGSSEVDVTDIKRVVAPCSIALVIDSSGSMKNDMKATLEAAKVFIGTLPAGSFVKVIDFDAKVNVLKGETPADAAKALSGITAGGTTKLFDATLKGLETVIGKTRPAVVVFTDGVDSSMDKTGGGSVNSRSAVTAKIKESKIPVYTIGFGKRLNETEAAKANAPTEGIPDIQTLMEFASAAGGQYYPAKNPSALQGVFAAISSKLGNNFIITYTRPSEHNLSETPFISMVVDNSGSMNTDPSVGVDCNYRMEKTISLFHDFVSKMPQNAMMQFTTFQTPPMSPVLIIQQQITTDQKANILKSLGEMKANGGTPIVEVLRTAYENILPVPSSRKIIVLLTDGGLLVEPDQIGQFNELLAKIKEKNITLLFIGMGVQSKEKLFADAAAASGGDYVISENIEDIQVKLDKLLQTLKETTPPDSIPISVSIKWTTPGGEELSYAVADDVKFALPPKAGPALEPDLVKIATGTPYKRYDEKVAAAVTGFGIPGTDNIITNKITFDKKLANKAMELTVKQGVYLSRFMGVDGDSNDKQFVALEIELENITSDKIPYEIPSLFNHFYLGVNGEGLYPASKATWLAEKPISPHGNPQITVEPGKKISGVIVFVVPAGPGFTQQSLHFYDTNYGHIQLALTGKMSDKWLTLDKLPASAPAQLSDAFTVQVTAASLKPKVDKYPAADRSVFRLVEAQFESKVQALLNLDPAERIWLKVETQSGALLGKMSGVTAALPFGFLEPVMLGPASDNKVRLAFDLPQMMGKFKSSVYFDLATGKAEVPVSAGEVYGAPKAIASVDGPGIKVIVNQITALDAAIQFTMPDGKASQEFGNTVLLDVTIADIPGNEGTRIPSDFFVLVNKNYKAPAGGSTAGRVGLGGGSENDSNMLKPLRETQNLVFGVDASFGVFEGQSRRGIVVFPKPREPLADWSLQSPYVESLNVPITTGKFSSPELLGMKTEVGADNKFAGRLDAAVTAAVARYRTLQESTSAVSTQISLEKDDGRESVPMPPISIYGIQKMAQITTEQQVLETMQSLRCLPINREGGAMQTYGYQPEAVLAQGWGEIGDMTNLAKQLFSKLGFAPEARALTLTEAGKKLLKEQSGLDPDRERTVPIGLAYQNAAGDRKMFVIPFMMDISGLEGLVYYSSESLSGYMGNNTQTADMRISVRYIPGEKSGTAAGTAGDVGGILGGSEGGETYSELLMIERKIPISTLSMDALDLCFMPRLSGGKPNSFSALLGTPDGVVVGETVLENPTQILGIKIEIGNISGLDRPLVHYSTLGEGDSLSNFFQTIAINIPDLTEEAAQALDTVVKQVHDASKNPDPQSIAKWYGRNIIYQFISGQSMFDSQMVNDLNLVMGRIARPRCIIVTSSLDKANIMQTTIDLLQPWNEIRAGEDAAKRAYNFAAGFYLSALEAEVLPGANKVGYLDLWTQAPTDTTIQSIPVMEDSRDEILKEMTAMDKYPALLLNAVKENKNLILAPSVPTVFNGQKRWAWLEIDPDTFQAISVFDTGLHSGMSEFKLSLIPTEDDTIKWLKGIWVGTNVAVWTMCSSSLKYGDNYKQVLADAKATALEVAKTVQEFYEVVEAVKNKEIKLKIPLGDTHKIEFKISMAGIKGSLKQSMYSLSGGMKLAIDAYFKVIVPKPPKK